MYAIVKVYYDTPYDRHVILEESHDVRYRKRNSKTMEEPPGLGSRILRRLSSKTKETSVTSPAANSPTAGPSSGLDHRGTPKIAVPNSPWRYPFRRTPIIHPPGLQRTMSQDSTTSSIASVAATGLPPMHKVALSRMIP